MLIKRFKEILLYNNSMKLPEEIVNKIYSFMSHPTADVMRPKIEAYKYEEDYVEDWVFFDPLPFHEWYFGRLQGGGREGPPSPNYGSESWWDELYIRRLLEVGGEDEDNEEEHDD
jgi:hypothetical protein